VDKIYNVRYFVADATATSATSAAILFSILHIIRASRHPALSYDVVRSVNTALGSWDYKKSRTIIFRSVLEIF